MTLRQDLAKYGSEMGHDGGEKPPSGTDEDLLEKSNLEKKDRDKLKEVSNDLLNKLKKLINYIDNWREKRKSQAKIKVVIYNYLPETYDFDEINKKRDIVYNHFFENYAKSNNNTYSIYS